MDEVLSVTDDVVERVEQGADEPPGDRLAGTEWGRDLVEVEPLLDLPDPFGGQFPWHHRGEGPYWTS